MLLVQTASRARVWTARGARGRSRLARRSRSHRPSDAGGEQALRRSECGLPPRGARDARGRRRPRRGPARRSALVSHAGASTKGEIRTSAGTARRLADDERPGGEVADPLVPARDEDRDHPDEVRAGQDVDDADDVPHGARRERHRRPGLEHDADPVQRLPGRAARVQDLEGDVVAPEDRRRSRRPRAASASPLAAGAAQPRAVAEHEQERHEDDRLRSGSRSAPP